MWNRDPDTRIRYRAGTTDATGGVSRPDGINAIQFRDINGFFAQDFTCDGTPGTVAAGGFWIDLQQVDRFRDIDFVVILEADVVVNDGADFGFPAGIDIFLPGTGGPPDPCGLPLGSGRFCSDPACGPCSAGQGDCDSDAECASGLTCEDNVGASFGFAPGIDVCMQTICTSEVGRGNFRSVCGPCTDGQGDCDSDTECAAGLVCVDDVGPVVGFGPRVDARCGREGR